MIPWVQYYSMMRAGAFYAAASCFLWCLSLFMVYSAAKAQNTSEVHSVVFEGNHLFSANRFAEVLSTQKGKPFSEQTLRSDLEHILELYKNQGYLHARVDSTILNRDTLRHDIEIHVFLMEGKPSVLRRLELLGCRNLTSAEVRAMMQLHEGDPFIPSMLEHDVQIILQQYEHNGYPLAKVVMKDILFMDSVNEMSVQVMVQIIEGEELHVTEMRVEGNRTTKNNIVMREARLKENEIFRSELPERIKRRLDHLQLFSSVSLPELYLTDSEHGGLLVRVVEGNQNSFDGVLGYVPQNNSGGQGYVTGLVNVSLRNLFGTGRKLSARWYQENAASQETELHYFEPWVASYPVNVQLGFLQRKQDSTYVRLQYDVSADLMVTDQFSVGVSFSQSGVYPTEGYGRSVMEESKSTSIGASVRYDSRDDPTTPTGGVFYSTEYQTGTKQSSGTGLLQMNSTNSMSRVVLDLSYYLSPFRKQVTALELHLRNFESGSLDMSDLFRLGGAATLRGYREGQFLGSRLVWVNTEYRFLVASRSYFYGLVDLAYIAQPEIVNFSLSSSEQSKIGYGIGVRMDSALGLIGVSFAMGEGDTFSTSKIHIRLTNEF